MDFPSKPNIWGHAGVVVGESVRHIQRCNAVFV
jgi:hypothetical protein